MMMYSFILRSLLCIIWSLQVGNDPHQSEVVDARCEKMLIISGMSEANYSCLFLDYKMYLDVNGL